MLSRRTLIKLGILAPLTPLALSLSACGSSKGVSGAVTADDIRARGYLKAGVKTDVPGYGYQDPATGEFEGLEIDLAYMLAAKILNTSFEEAKANRLVSFVGVTAKTRGPLVDSGEVDCVIATYTISEERKKSWNFSTPYYSDSVGLLVLKSSGMKSVKDLNNKIIGIGQGANTEKATRKMMEEKGLGDYNLSFPQYLDYPSIAAALASGNVDVFAIDRSILRGYMNDSNELLEPELRFGLQDYGICTNLAAKELADLCDELVQEKLSDGTLDSLVKQYELA